MRLYDSEKCYVIAVFFVYCCRTIRGNIINLRMASLTMLQKRNLSRKWPSKLNCYSMPMLSLY